MEGGIYKAYSPAERPNRCFQKWPPDAFKFTRFREDREKAKLRSGRAQELIPEAVPRKMRAEKGGPTELGRSVR